MYRDQPRTRALLLYLIAACTWVHCTSAQCLRSMVDTVRSTVGNETVLPLQVRVPGKSQGSIVVRAELQVRNPTLLYPIELRSLGTPLDSTEIKSMRPGVFSLRFVMPYVSDSIAELELRVLSLAGTDTASAVVFDSVVIGGTVCTGDSVVFVSRSLDHEGTYVRPLFVGSTIPLPCETCSELQWKVYSDRADTVRTEIVDIIGRSIDQFVTAVPAGETIIRYNHRGPQTYNGVYAVIFRSNTGSAVRWIVLAE